jgi:DNA ligase (NAD+)
MKTKIEQLRSELHEHNHKYYVLSQPTISDFEFDSKLKELQSLELQHPEFYDSNSPTIRVGSDISNSFKQVYHKFPMLSLGNTYNTEELTDFYNRLIKGVGTSFELVSELKFDGTSISLTYENGEIKTAVTRGDGEKGDDVTDNIKTIKSIPLKLSGSGYPALFEVRGEILMPFDSFEYLNKERIENGDEPFANPRNAVSGSIKQRSSSVVAKRKLDAYFYYLISNEVVAKTHYENLLKLKEWGFKVSSESKLCETLQDVFDFIDLWNKKRHKLDFATDGIVLKMNQLDKQKELGLTSKSPRWAISYKFEAENVSTPLKSVVFQVGRQGTVTPVANLEPVQLGGTVVRRASLYNEDYLNEIDLYECDTVYVEKGGEIIPKITGVDYSKRIEGSKPIIFPDECPECGSELTRKENEANYFCLNENCPARVKGRLEHFVSRKAMNINIGPETIDLLVESQLIICPTDLYTLEIDDLIGLDRFGVKKAENLINSIQESKNNSFQKVLYALGIQHLGETVSKKLVKHYNNIFDLSKTTVEELIQIDEIGETIAKSIVNWFSKEENIEVCDWLEFFGLNIENEEVIQTENKLDSKIYVITGSFEGYSRDELKDIIEGNGGKTSGSVSNKTDYLLAGENCGSKLDKAKELGVKIIGTEELFKFIK